MFITCDFYPSFLPGDSLDNACFQERLGSFWWWWTVPSGTGCQCEVVRWESSSDSKQCERTWELVLWICEDAQSRGCRHWIQKYGGFGFLPAILLFLSCCIWFFCPMEILAFVFSSNCFIIAKNQVLQNVENGDLMKLPIISLMCAS